jgi:hypothetical protein
VPGAILAAVPDNTEGGAYLTIAFPLLLFIVIAAVLYIVLFARPHARVPARRVATVANVGPPSPEAAEAAAIAAGLPLAEGVLICLGWYVRAFLSLPSPPPARCRPR